MPAGTGPGRATTVPGAVHLVGVAEVDPAAKAREALSEQREVGVLRSARDVAVAVAGLGAELLDDAELGGHRLPRLPRDEHAAEPLALGLAQEPVDRRPARERLEAPDVLRCDADAP